MTHIRKDFLNDKKHIHFIGIGGSGMFPLVQILHGMGYYITGSDNNPGDTIDFEREKMDIPVVLGQKAENIKGADLIVHTAAIMDDNPELIAARESGVPTIERADLLGLVTSWFDNCVCICGTHGKTTTTAMLTQMFMECGMDPSAVVGGKLPAIGGSGRLGKSDIMVCEACEFEDHFLKCHPDIAVILNVDADHLEYFKTLDNIIASFHKFAQMTTKTVIYNGDDINSCKAVEGVTSKKMITFGMDEKNAETFTAVCEALEKKGYTFVSADVAMVPSTTTTLTDPDQLVQMGKLLDALDDDDDVQNAWHSLENEEDLDR